MHPVFILGNIGSGTTILHQTLLQAVAEATDIDFSDQESRPFWMKHGMECGSPLTGTYCGAATRGSISESSKSRIRNAFDRVFSRGQRIFTKNPHFCNKIPLLHDLFPDASYVHIVRQDLSVVATMKKKFIGFCEGDTPWQTSCVHYWPEGDNPCWNVLSRQTPTRWQLIREKLRRLIRKRTLTETPAFADWPQFQKEHSDPSRYFPGEGFCRLEEAWIRSNLNIVRDVESLRLKNRYLAINYHSLVEQPESTFDCVAAFSGVKYREGFRFNTLRPDRQDKWKEDLTLTEVAVCELQRKVFQSEVTQLSKQLPGPLFAG